MSEEPTKECASAITPLLNGHKGKTIYCNAPRVKGSLFCSRHQHSMQRVYLARITLTEYDYYLTDLDGYKD